MRAVQLLMGHVFLVIALIGIFLPLLPTTPFLLLTSYFYSRGSERFHHWLHTHPRLGPPIIQWQQFGVIRRPIKIVATTFLIASLSFPVFFREFPWALKGLAVATGLAVVVFIWTRPSKPADLSNTEKSSSQEI